MNAIRYVSKFLVLVYEINHLNCNLSMVFVVKICNMPKISIALQLFSTAINYDSKYQKP